MNEVRPITNSYRYWSNGCGDLFMPDSRNDESITRQQLPKDIQKLYDNLWTDEKAFLCYLAELDGKHGIALEDEYNECTAESYGFTYAEYIEKAKAFAAQIAERFPKFTTMFSKDIREWSDGSKDSILAVFMPSNVTKEEFDSLAEYMEENHPAALLANA